MVEKLGGTQVGHVGMVIEKTEGSFKMIHAAVSGGVRIDDYNAPYYKARFLFGKRLELVQ
jgi:cell wall-associated NlpC family hydrolase